MKREARMQSHPVQIKCIILGNKSWSGPQYGFPAQLNSAQPPRKDNVAPSASQNEKKYNFGNRKKILGSRYIYVKIASVLEMTALVFMRVF